MLYRLCINPEVSAPPGAHVALADPASPTIKSLPLAPLLAFYPLGKKQPFLALPGFLLL